MKPDNWVAIPGHAVDQWHISVFSGFHLGPNCLGFDGVVGVVCSKPGGFVVLDFVRINILDIPEW